MADRNQLARDRMQAQRELGQQLAKFARDLNAGKTGMVDRFGARVDKGDFVLYRPMYDLIFEVTDVVPVLDMSAPPGTVTLKLECTTDVQFMASARAMTIVKCGTKARDVDGAADLTPPGTNAPADTPVDQGDPDAEAKAAEPPTDLPAPGEPPEQVDEPPPNEQEPT